MTKRLFKNFDDAFAPMFDDVISLESNGIRTSVNACVFPPEDVDPFSDVDATTDLKRINILIKKPDEASHDFNVKIQPKIGDTIVLEDNSKWNITKCSFSQSEYQIEARG